jgi:O-acetyl-ADP-ribose deacetylase (regulator of RNase III)
MNAAADGNAACLQLLLGGGADWALRSKADQSALGLAEDVKSYDSELKKWGKAECCCTTQYLRSQKQMQRAS